jgi:hypothetical protein
MYQKYLRTLSLNTYDVLGYPNQTARTQEVLILHFELYPREKDIFKKVLFFVFFFILLLEDAIRKSWVQKVELNNQQMSFSCEMVSNPVLLTDKHDLATSLTDP